MISELPCTQLELQSDNSLQGWIATFGKRASLEPIGPAFRGPEANARELHLAVSPTDKSPCHSTGRSCNVIFDGVLYNRAELSELLNAPLGASDSDVILLAFVKWGEEFLRKIKGIFSLIIWDGGRDTLLCARDPLGVVP